MGLDNPLHIAFLVVILLLVFGAKRLPGIGRSLGTGMREFKESVTGETQSRRQRPSSRAQPAAQPAPRRRRPPWPSRPAGGSARRPAWHSPRPVTRPAAPPSAAPVESQQHS